MNAQPETCDPSLIEHYLADKLDAAAESVFLSHLESCSTCRLRTEQAAAEPSSWSDAEEFLRDQPFDAVSFGTSSDLHDCDDDLRNRKAAASPERTISSGGGRISGSVDSTLDRLRDEALKTGDLSKVLA